MLQSFLGICQAMTLFIIRGWNSILLHKSFGKSFASFQLCGCFFWSKDLYALRFKRVHNARVERIFWSDNHQIHRIAAKVFLNCAELIVWQIEVFQLALSTTIVC